MIFNLINDINYKQTLLKCLSCYASMTDIIRNIELSTEIFETSILHA